jgi:hypothetical protein
MLANLKIICQFHAQSVHQNSVEIVWAEIYRGRLLTLILNLIVSLALENTIFSMPDSCRNQLNLHIRQYLCKRVYYKSMS